MNTQAIKIIEALGGVAEVSRIFKIAMPSVSNWKHEGIPDARMMYLKVAYAAQLKGIDLDAATSQRLQGGGQCLTRHTPTPASLAPTP